MTVYSGAPDSRGWWMARGPLQFLISLLPVGSLAQHVYECTTNPPAGGITGKTFTLPLGECIIPVSDAYDVHSWGAQIGVTTKAGATVPFCFVPSTEVNSTIIMDSEMCQPSNLDRTTMEQCRSFGGNFIDRSELDTMNPYDILVDNVWVLADKSPVPYPFEYAAHITLTTDLLTMNMPIGITGIAEFEGMGNVAPTKQAQLGLAQNSTFSNYLYKNGLSTGHSWALDVGSVSDKRPRKGSLVFGGFDQNKKTSDWHEVPMDYAPVNYGKHCPLQLSIDKIELEVQPPSGRPNRTTLFEPQGQVSACLEPNDYLAKFPTAAHQEFLRHLKDAAKVEPVSSNSFKPTSELFIPEPSLAFFSKQATFNLTLIVALVGGFVVEIPSHEMLKPLRGLGADGSTVIDDKITEIPVSSTSAGNTGDEPLSLGRSFLSQVYLFVSQKERIIRLSHQSKDLARDDKPDPKPWVCDSMNVGKKPPEEDDIYGSRPPPPPTPTEFVPPRRTVGGIPSLSRPEIAGIASAACILSFFLLMGLGWWIYYGRALHEKGKKRKRAREVQEVAVGVPETGHESSALGDSSAVWGESSPEIMMPKKSKVAFG